MFTQAIPNGRRRTLDRNKKRLFCDTVARGATMTEAAAALGVSLRTVQREARRDAAFDEELRAVHHSPNADPLTLLKSHARRHWRASAWLLERERPEEYGRRSPSSCSPFRFDQELRTILEAALEATPAAQRDEVYEHVHAACERAFKNVFPTYGAFGRPRKPAPAVTPLADAHHLAHLRNGGGVHIPDEVPSWKPPASPGEGHGSRPPVGWVDRPRQPITDPTSKDEFPQCGEPTPPSPMQPPASPGGRSPSTQTPTQRSVTPGQRPGLQKKVATDFTPRLSHRYGLRTAATLNQLDPAALASTITERFLSLLSPPTHSDTSGDTSPPLAPHFANIPTP